ncbi:hypothetical protein BAY32_07020 [Elizabethkingia ursingii]|uniref:Uncharacterized protein n=1 Tax=Elizabethkingia ursingii TaxID=1756150 RepID=A0AAJ3TPL4_9FLAO|nr:hypothetical protein BBD34_13265 [Elizabethkingia ursingii]OPB75285.1 hypothetical protein BAY32_07020 [Elizabethkingia ursingii]OPB93050.1 hypothetical protein BB021_01250 [Elizabethkingia ursingii]
MYETLSGFINLNARSFGNFQNIMHKGKIRDFSGHTLSHYLTIKLLCGKKEKGQCILCLSY